MRQSVSQSVRQFVRQAVSQSVTLFTCRIWLSRASREVNTCVPAVQPQVVLVAPFAVPHVLLITSGTICNTQTIDTERQSKGQDLSMPVSEHGHSV